METQFERQPDPEGKPLPVLKKYPGIESFALGQGLAILRAVLRARKSSARITVNGRDGETSGVMDRRPITRVHFEEKDGVLQGVHLTVADVDGDPVVANMTDEILMPDLIGLPAPESYAILMELVAEYAAINQGETFPVVFQNVDEQPEDPPYSENQIVQSTVPGADSPIDASGVLATIIVNVQG